MQNSTLSIFDPSWSEILAAFERGLCQDVIPSPSSWLFGYRLNMAVLSGDGGLRSQVVEGLLLLALAAAALAIGYAGRRLRLPALLVAGGLLGFATPGLGLLFVQVFPTSDDASPTGFSTTSIAQGALLYPDHCSSCHGFEGRGDGPAAAGLPVPPADLTARHLWGHSDGELYWYLSHGIEAPQGGLAMPGFADTLKPYQIWNLIDFIRAHNAGLTHAATATWSPPLAAPDIYAACADGSTTTLRGLRGKVVRIVFQPEPSPVPPVPEGLDRNVGVETLIVPNPDSVDMTLPQDACIGRDPAVRTAYATVLGAASSSLDGLQLLVDPAGWLRAAQRPGEKIADNWDDPRALQAAIIEICRHPVDPSRESYAHAR